MPDTTKLIPVVSCHPRESGDLITRRTRKIPAFAGMTYRVGRGWLL